MGNSIKKSIHIEFYGLPGSGKSTVSHLIAQNILKNGYQITEDSFDLDHRERVFNRKIKKIIKSILFMIHHIKQAYSLYELIKKNGYVGFKSVFRQFINIAPKLYIYNLDDGVIHFWDEGLVQSTISLLINYDITDNDYKYRDLLIPSEKKVIKIYIYTDIDNAIERMNLREKHDSRVEKEHDEEKKIQLIMNIKRLCDSVSYTYRVDNYNLTNTVDFLTKQIVETLRNENVYE